MSARSRKQKVADTDKPEGTPQSVSMTSKSVTIERSRMSTADTPRQSMSRNERSSSPLSISRNEEKDELAHLNDRLAGYIDYVRKLECDKERLTRRIHSVTEERMSKVEEARKTYEDEILALRNLVDDLAKQKTKAELEAKQAKEQASEAKAKLAKRDVEIRNLHRKIDDLERDLASLKQDQDRYQERDKLVQRTMYVEEEVEGRKQAEYESRLADELQSIREQTSSELEEYKTQIETTFETKLGKLRPSVDHSDMDRRQRTELMASRKRSDELSHELAKKVSEMNLLQNRVDELLNQLDRERKDHEDRLSFERQEVLRLKDELEESFRDFADLMNTKIALDQEILMYRKMLEGEESRLNLHPNARDSPFNVTSGKRRRVDDESEGQQESGLTGSGFISSKARYAYRVSSTTSGPVEFFKEQDTQGKWVKLNNSSTEDVTVGGWELVHESGGTETRFKFHRSLTLKPGTVCTVWSGDSEVTHNPPTDIVMKNKSFHAAPEATIALLDTDGVEQAKCAVRRERIRPSGVSFGRRAGNRAGTDEKCMVM